jgi:hypothetical protein
MATSRRHSLPTQLKSRGKERMVYKRIIFTTVNVNGNPMGCRLGTVRNVMNRTGTKWF